MARETAETGACAVIEVDQPMYTIMVRCDGHHELRQPCDFEINVTAKERQTCINKIYHAGWVLFGDKGLCSHCIKRASAVKKRRLRKQGAMVAA